MSSLSKSLNIWGHACALQNLKEILSGAEAGGKGLEIVLEQYECKKSRVPPLFQSSTLGLGSG